jgi:hypothetical protein
MREFMEIVQKIVDGAPQFLYHATPRQNLQSIMTRGLLVDRYGEIHGSMEYAPPVPCIYLSRDTTSNNLHTNLTSTDYIVLKIDMSALDPNLFYPDDAFGQAVMDEEYLTDELEIMRALGVDEDTAAALLEQISEITGSEGVIALLKPFWRYWLAHPDGGEVAYAGNIPPSAIHPGA